MKNKGWSILWVCIICDSKLSLNSVNVHSKKRFMNTVFNMVRIKFNENSKNVHLSFLVSS